MIRRTAVRGLAISLAAGVACAVSTAEARIVHNASAALRAAADAAANPYVDANGATWTVYSRALPNDGTKNLISGQAVVTATPTAKGLGSYDGWCFVVGTAGTTDEPISGLGSGAVRAGDLVYHPQADTRVALRFTPPRTGRYSMSARFYTMNPGANGTIDATVLLNGATLLQESVPHNNGVGSSSSVCGFENVMLTTADCLEFVVGPGFGDGNGNGCDSTALSLSLVEEEKDACTALERYDANRAVVAMIAGGEVVNPHTDAAHAKWSLLGSYWSSWRVNETTLWDDYHADASQQLMAAYSDGWEGQSAVYKNEDWCRVSVNATGGDVVLDSAHVGKNEIMIHPGANACPMIRFTVPQRGTYLVTAVARHVGHSGSSYPDGVVVGLMAAGDQMVYGDFCCEAGGTPSGVVQAQTPILEAGETIDCMVHRGGNHTSDATTLGLTIMRLEDAAWKGHDIGAAVTAQFKDKAITTGAFTDANGGRWSTGYTTGLDDGPTPFPETGSLNDGNLSGLTVDGVASWIYLLANMTGAPLAGWFNKDLYPERSVMQRREVILHPAADKNPTLRFQVPEGMRGYYDVTFHLRDIQPMAQQNLGVVMDVTTNGVQVARTWAGWWRDADPGDYESSIRLKNLYLKPNTVLDFRLNCDGNNGGDLTALRGWIVPSGKEDDVFKPGLRVWVR